jgi:putative permease
MTRQTDFSNLDFVRDFFKRILPNSQVVSLAGLLLIGTLLIISLSNCLMPVFVAIVLAYLLEGLLGKTQRLGLPRGLAVYAVFFAFVASLGFVLFILVPIVSEQTIELVQGIPRIVNSAQLEILRFPQRYPELISESRSHELLFAIQQDLLKHGQTLLSGSAQSLTGLIAAIIYLFLVPLMVFFFLKDKQQLLNWFVPFLPHDRSLSWRVWQEVDKQLANYIRGKCLEVFIVWLASFLCFYWLNLNYAMLLAVMVGLSVVIPYIGATLVTVPVLAVAYVQWGLGHGDAFTYLVISYFLIHAIDGVVLVPVLFSEAVNLHPVAIIIAILFFGGVWGFWGVFFAIPLATLVNAVLTAWQRAGDNGLDKPEAA